MSEERIDQSERTIGGTESCGESADEVTAESAFGPGDVEAESAADEKSAERQAEAEREGVGRRSASRRRVSRRGRLLVKSAEVTRSSFGGRERMLILDVWVRSKLPAGDFAPLVGVSAHTLYEWKRKFEQEGPAGLENRVRGSRPGSRLSEPTKRAILMMKRSHPEWGCERIEAMLRRTAGYEASAGAIARLLKEEGYELVEQPTRGHPDKVRTFERARPNQLWQSDLFTFVLKRENRRVHLVVFMDDHSRFVTCHGLHATASGALVREVLESGVANYGCPEEVLTDNGPQYQTWRGTSGFTKLLRRRGIKHVVSRPRHPQTLGKVERFWGTLWRECLEMAVFRGLEDARHRVGLFVDYYNFQRTHQSLGGLVPADRYFSAAPQVLESLRARVAANALKLARDGEPRKSFYLTGRVGEQAISLHAEGERVVLTRDDGSREEVDLGATGRRQPDETITEPGEPVDVRPAVETAPGVDESPDAIEGPGTSVLDTALEELDEALGSKTEVP